MSTTGHLPAPPAPAEPRDPTDPREPAAPRDPGGEVPATPAGPPRPPAPPRVRRRLPEPTPAGLTALGLWLLLAAVVLLNSLGSFAVDTKPEIYFAPWRSAGAYLSAWQADPQLGFPSFNVGLAPVAAVVGLIQAVGIGPALSVRVLRLLLLVLGSWGAARLYRALRPGSERADPVGPLVAGTVAVANPYVVVAGATQPILLPWALLPWSLLCLVRAVRRPAGGAGWAARAGRWRWPAAFALVFAAASGMNAGVVPLFQLLAVPAVLLVVRRSDGLPWRRVPGVLTRCAVLVAAVSAYWVVPSLLALRAGSVVVENSETTEGIAGPSSAAEALRGLGIWPLYGSGPTGPWLPQFGAYLDSPAVVVASFALPVLAALAALLARGTARRLGLALVLLAVPIMVGVHPPEAPTPLGRAIRWTVESVPAAGAFRTTNKIGSLLTLGVALLVAAGAAAAVRRWRRPGPRIALAAGLVAVLAGGTAPAWTGDLYISTVDLPAYWKRAAADLDAGPADQRVWFVPGEVSASYRWSQERPDDLSTSLLSRPSLVRTVIPVTGPHAANLLAATDAALQEGTLPPGALSATARYLGVGDLLVRNDTVWEDAGGARPQVLQDQLNIDPGLRGRATYGEPGQNAVSPRYPPISAFEAALPPLQRYAVAGPRPVLRAEPTAGTVLVDGDGAAVAPLVSAGLLAGGPAFRYAGDLTAADLATLLRTGELGRVVLTDTNRRRATAGGRIGGGQGPLLPAGADATTGRALFDADRQTVLTVAGGSVTATDTGSAFGPVASSAAENAVDGDLRTAWRFGDFGRAVGQSLTLRLATPRTVPEVVVRVRTADAVRISRVRIEVGGERRDVDVDGTGAARLRLAAPVRADSVRVTVLATAGTGFNLVGVEEVQVPGVRPVRIARTPRTFQRLLPDQDTAGRAALDRTPVDVVLSRARSGGPAGDDEETGLARSVSTPVARTYRAYGLIRIGRTAEGELDLLAGASGPVSARSTSRAFDLPTVRASQAVDGRPDTAWVPGGPVVGQALTISAPRRRVDAVTLTLTPDGQRRPPDRITRVAVRLDGGSSVEAAVGPGTTRIPVPSTDARTVRITVLATASGDPAGSVRIAEVGFGGARIPFSARRARTACARVLSVDGEPVRMRPLQPVTSAAPSLWTGCDPVEVPVGEHLIRTTAAWAPDTLVLRDPLGEAVPAAVPAPRTTVTEGRGPRSTIRVSGARRPYYLVTGQAYDGRWRARLDGRDLGPPIVVDGYAAGWRIDSLGDSTIEIDYGPQRVTDLALLGSGLAVLGCLLLLGVPVAVARLPGRGGPGPAGPDGPGGPPALDGPAARRWWRREERGGRVWPLLGRCAGWAGVVALGWLVGDWPLGAAALLLAGWHLLRPPAPRTLIAAAAAVLAVVPVGWLALRPEIGDRVTARLVLDDPWPGRLAGLGLLLLGVGVVRAERRRPAGPAEPVGPVGPVGPAGAGRPEAPRLMSAPRVTAVVPTRDAARTLSACLHSIRAQDAGPVQLVVVDNDSTDGTFETARRLADIAVRGGPERSAQRNAGVELATGEWVFWIDADMVLAPDVVRRALATAERTGAVAVSVPEVSVGPGFWTACRALERSCYVGDEGMANPRLLRRDYLRSLGGFDPAMAGPEDADLRLRLRAAAAPTAYCHDATITHDEGRLTLRSVLAKRVYYGRSLPAFVAKNPGALAGQGAGTIRMLARHSGRLLRHPVLAAGIVALRLLEAVAYGVGYRQGSRALRARRR